MPEIEITEDQAEYLEALRRDIQQDVVGKYAHVRTVDAVQYLIDNHEGEINATVTEPSAGPAVSAENAPAADPEEGDEDGDADDATDADDADTDDEAEDATDEESEAEGDDPDAESEDDAEESSGGAASSPPMAAVAGGDDDGMLSAMMALMDTHDDKWEEASGDTGYEVELPDGSTESANTQDDVRALLFKHYE